LYAGNPGLWGGAAGFDAGLQASLYLNFLAGAPLDPRITFTRGSNATLVDSTGKITYAPANLLLQSQTFDNASWTKDAGTITANATTAPDGTSTADKFVATATTAFHGLYQSVIGTVASYTYSVYAKAAEYSKLQLANGSAGTWSATFDLATGATIATGGTAVLSSSIQSAGDGWYRCSVTFTGAATNTAHSATGYPNTGATLNNFGASYTGNGTSGVFLWGAQLEPVTYQTTPSTYVATTTAAYYGPRFDYDPVTLAAKGLLIEEQRTNLLLQSQTFDNASWTKTGSTISANATTAPDGTLTADKLQVANTTSSQKNVGQTVGAISTTYADTVYAKASELSWLVINQYDGSDRRTWFNLSNGTVGTTAAGTTATIEALSNGWYRCRAVRLMGTGSIQLVLNVADADNSAVFVGTVGQGIFLWGAQREAGSFATSYIPTVASQVTRSADNASMTGTNFSSWYNQTEGTFVASFQNVVDTVGGGKVVFSANDGTNNNRIAMITTSALVEGRIVVGGVATNPAQRAITPNAVAKSAIGAAAGNAAQFTNGVLNSQVTPSSLPTVNRLEIGANLASTFLNGHIRSITYYNTRLSNATLVSLTA
jgi:hypothetical protein